MRNILAAAWADDLSGRMTFPAYPQRRDAGALPPFAVVRVPELMQLSSGTDVWHGEVQVVVVHDIAPSGQTAGAVASHHGKVREVYHALEATPRNGAVDVERGIKLYGYELHRHEEVQVQGPRGEKVYADVFHLTVGVGAYAEP